MALEQSSKIIGEEGSVLSIKEGHAGVELRGLYGTIKSSAVNVRTGAVRLPSTTMPKRKTVCIYVPSTFSGTFYVGGSGVTTRDGFPVRSGNYIMIDTESDVYGVATDAVEVRVLEVS